MSPGPPIPVVGCNLSFKLFPSSFLKPERHQQSLKSSGFELNKSQIPVAGTEPESYAHAFSPGTPAENVFSRNASLGVLSLKMSVCSPFDTLGTLGAPWFVEWLPGIGVLGVNIWLPMTFC